MSNKILICVYVPFCDKMFELFVPYGTKIGSIKKMLNNILCGSMFSVDDLIKSLRLLDRSSGVEFDLDQNICESTIVNGSNLVLM